MAVDDYGLEVLKKSGEQVIDGNPSDCYIKTSTINCLIQDKYDYVAVTYPTTTTEVFTFKLGGVSGTTVSTVTITYTDANKSYISSVVKA
jgi:hypothetical protein